MTDALTLCGVFLLGLMLGSGAVGAFVGWVVAQDDRTVAFLVGFLRERPDLCDQLATELQKERAR